LICYSDFRFPIPDLRFNGAQRGISRLLVWIAEFFHVAAYSRGVGVGCARGSLAGDHIGLQQLEILRFKQNRDIHSVSQALDNGALNSNPGRDLDSFCTRSRALMPHVLHMAWQWSFGAVPARIAEAARPIFRKANPSFIVRRC